MQEAGIRVEGDICMVKCRDGGHIFIMPIGEYFAVEMHDIHGYSIQSAMSVRQMELIIKYLKKRP